MDKAVEKARAGWSEAQIPDQAGKVAVVTGANSGIGFEAARALAAGGAHVVLAVRSTERGAAAVSAILAGNPRASLEVMALDLANLASVHRFADAFQRRFEALALLVNNAGVASASLQHTADGFELLFGTNHLGHFALTGRLLPSILAAKDARVITVASLTHVGARIDFENLDASMGYAPTRAYAQSKLANMLFAYELQRRFTRVGATAISLACHPGWALTGMTAGTHGPSPRLFDRFFRRVSRRLAPSPVAGARPTVFAATSPDVRGGDYVGPSGAFGVWGRPGRVRSSALSHDQDLARRLWQVSESMTGVSFGEFEAVRPGSAVPRTT